MTNNETTITVPADVYIGRARICTARPSGQRDRSTRAAMTDAQRTAPGRGMWLGDAARMLYPDLFEAGGDR